MDEIVKQAMAKWPDVPHCYGWLALDARGAWRMRDERAQQLGLPGDKLAHAALVGFINRNYLADARGCWYFQNGPQRVYVNLEAAPFVARSDPAQGWLLHTGEPLGTPEAAWLRADGAVLLAAHGKLAQVDDRDMAQLLRALELDGRPAGDDALLAWLAGTPGALALRERGRVLPVQRLDAGALPPSFAVVRTPQP